jgi:hypothetical protein
VSAHRDAAPAGGVVRRSRARVTGPGTDLTEMSSVDRCPDQTATRWAGTGTVSPQWVISSGESTRLPSAISSQPMSTI